MNCHDFELMAGELAAGRLMDAMQRETALAHAADCPGCAARLADERALTDGLRFIAGTSNENAPARVEAALLAAFRDGRTEPAVIPISSRRRRWVYTAASAAAIALIVTLLAFLAARSRGVQEPVPQKAGPLPPALPNERQAIPAPQDLPAVPDHNVAGNHRRRPERVKNAGRRESNRQIKPTREPEIATDFIPLMNRESLAQMDGGQVMRVELPRSALMSFGLPMDMERATERIKADVVVGNDGLARAIRFVR